MLVKFIHRLPGNHHEIGQSKMNSVPREKELVVINDTTYIVQRVIWNLTEMSVTISLDD